MKHTHKINKERYQEMFPGAEIISEEYRKKISEREKNKWSEVEFKQKMSNIRKITHNKTEFKQKMSEKIKKIHKEDPNIFSGFTNYHKTEEFKKWVKSEERITKISESSKKRWGNIEYREKVINSLKRILNDGRCEKNNTFKEKMSKIVTELFLNGKLNNEKSIYKTGYYLDKLGEKYYYASSLEEESMVYLDTTSLVESWTNKHKIVIPYILNGVKKNYIPDFLIKLKNGEEWIVEMKGWVSEEVLIKENFTKKIYNNYKIFYNINELKNFIENETN